MIILTVDDTPSVRKLIGKLVKTLKCTIAEAGDGKEGLAKLAELKAQGTPPKIILTDYNMPVMDGITFIKEVRKTDRTTPILMVTTVSEEGKQKEGKMAGANGWMTKPISPSTFLPTIKKMAGI